MPTVASTYLVVCPTRAKLTATLYVKTQLDPGGRSIGAYAILVASEDAAMTRMGSVTDVRTGPTGLGVDLRLPVTGPI